MRARIAALAAVAAVIAGLAVGPAGPTLAGAGSATWAVTVGRLDPPDATETPGRAARRDQSAPQRRALVARDTADSAVTGGAGSPPVAPPNATQLGTLLLAVDTSGTAGPHSRATPADLPLVGTVIAPVTRTCHTGRVQGTPTTSAVCLAWSAAGPVNVVVIGAGASAGTDPTRLATAGGQWRPAAGNWLVARGATGPSSSGCPVGWHDSAGQIEVRLSPRSRRHFKAISATCDGPAGRLHLVFGDAHTDLYEPAGCRGDHAVDWDAARDALVGSLRSSRETMSVVYVQAYPPGTTFPGGCGAQIHTDGRVAYVVLGSGGKPAKA